MATVHDVAQRRADIAAITAQVGNCSVAELASRFSVTPETIRRDLKVLEDQDKVRRVHGGAVTARAHVDTLAVDDDDALPVHQSQRRKQAIGLAALELITKPNASMFIDAGTTAEAFANVLARNYLGQQWLIVTNSPNVARTLASAGVQRLTMLGGIVKSRTQAVVGEPALATLQNLRADIAFMGTNELSVEGGLTTSDPREAEVKRSMMQAAAKTVVLCESSKIRSPRTPSFASLDCVDVVVTDRNVPAHFANQLDPYQIHMVIS